MPIQRRIWKRSTKGWITKRFGVPSPRYEEDVTEGEEIPAVVKGPLSLSDMVAWASGISWHRMGLAHGPKLRFLRDHPGLGYTDPKTGAPEPIANSHFDPDAARHSHGFPPSPGSGVSAGRVAEPPGHQLDGRFGVPQAIECSLKRLRAVRGYQLVPGEGVVRTRHEGCEARVELEVLSRNQRAETTAIGNAVVVLPSRKSGKQKMEA